MNARRLWRFPIGRAAALALGPALLALAASGCGGKATAEAEAKAGAESAEPKPVKVTLVPVRRERVERTVEVIGSLRGWEQIGLGAKKGGQVLKVHRDMGDHVKPGEALVEIDPIDAQLAVAQARSRYQAGLALLGITREDIKKLEIVLRDSENKLLADDPKDADAEVRRARDRLAKAPSVQKAQAAVVKAHQSLERQRQLNARGAGTQQDLDNQENDYRAAEAARDDALLNIKNALAQAVAAKNALDIAEQQLRDMTIAAPLPSKCPEGIDRDALTYGVTKRSVGEGQILKDGEAVYELVIEDPLRLWTTVPEKYAARVKLGQEVRLRVPAYPGEVFVGKVARVNPSVDPVSRTFQVETAVRNADNRLHPGGFAKAAIVVQTDAEADVVPIESVVHFAGVTKLFVAEADRARTVEVATGIEFVPQGEKGVWVEILGGLPGGAQVVTSGQTQLAEGTRIEVRDAPKDDPEPLTTAGRPPARH